MSLKSAIINGEIMQVILLFKNQISIIQKPFASWKNYALDKVTKTPDQNGKMIDFWDD